MENKLKYLVSLNNFPKFGPKRLKKLYNRFKDWETAFTAGVSDLIEAGLDRGLAEEFAAARLKLDPDELMARLERENIKTVVLGGKDYPELLAEIYDPPYLLYYRGSLAECRKYNLAVIGTRKNTVYGRQVAEQLTTDLVKNGFAITSGLALGIDSIAHEATIKQNGLTFAVLGSGIDRQSIYPSANRYLAEKIADSGGAILSEFPLGTPPLRHHFPQRNRLIAGLTLATIVVEADEKSGALITAAFALEQNREVFAVPGSIFSPVSRGPNSLIKRGAAAVTGADDILKALDLAQVASYIESEKIIPETENEKVIIAHIAHEPIHINELVRLTNLDTSHINSTLVIMEMKGMVKNVGGMKYIIGR